MNKFVCVEARLQGASSSEMRVCWWSGPPDTFTMSIDTGTRLHKDKLFVHAPFLVLGTWDARCECSVNSVNDVGECSVNVKYVMQIFLENKARLSLSVSAGSKILTQSHHTEWMLPLLPRLSIFVHSHSLQVAIFDQDLSWWLGSGQF